MGKDKHEQEDLPGGPQQKDKQSAGRQRNIDDSFTGRAGQFAVMAELMRLHCNAAVPEVDVGTDVFAFKDDRAEVVRIQVKACTSTLTYADGSGYSAKFSLPMKQFHRQDDRPPLYYALAVLREDRWVDYLIVRRARLQTYYYGREKFGSYSKTNDDLVITVEFRKEVTCSGQDLTDCRNAWRSLPPLQPSPNVEQAVLTRAKGEDPAAGSSIASANQPPPGLDQP